jgi:ubiquinone/menaquinone biosynthesis C-methylase UbiE
MPERVDYDRIAPTYDRRFAANRREATTVALLELIEGAGAERILEVGCGTGHWLAGLDALGRQVYGLDLSAGMLQQARKRRAQIHLVRGRAEHLPFPGAAFDLVYCVNAIHHFGRPRAFVAEARRLLAPGGRLAVIGTDPHGRAESWYVYRYFAGVNERDLRRFPSWGTVLDWMIEERLDDVKCRPVEQIVEHKVGREVLGDPFLQKNACSQLALLSDAAYAAGLRRIEAALRRAEASGTALVFSSEITIAMLVGRAR